MGTAEERVVLYHLLQRVWPDHRMGPMNVLQGFVRKTGRFRRSLKDFKRWGADRRRSRKRIQASSSRGRRGICRGNTTTFVGDSGDSNEDPMGRPRAADKVHRQASRDAG